MDCLPIPKFCIDFLPIIGSKKECALGVNIVNREFLQSDKLERVVCTHFKVQLMAQVHSSLVPRPFPVF